MFDCHVHSSFSGDSKLDPIDACKAAIERGLEGIIFTDHLDYDFPGFDDTFNIDFPYYIEFMENIKYNFNGSLKVLKGIEAGIQPHVIDDTLKVIEGNDFDFCIGSVHIIDGKDPYAGDYYDGRTKFEAFNRYLEEIYKLMDCFTNYDVLGHIGYIRRYGNYEDKSLKYNDFSEIIDCILKKAVETGKGLDVNTSGYRVGFGEPLTGYDVLKRYYELGGEIICIGSDAHYLEHIGHSFHETSERLKNIGFKYAAYFEKRKPVFYSL